MKAYLIAAGLVLSGSVIALAQTDTTGPTGKAQGTGSAGAYGNAGNSSGSPAGSDSGETTTGSGTAGGGASGEVRNSPPVGTAQDAAGDPRNGAPTDRAVPNASMTGQGG